MSSRTGQLGFGWRGALLAVVIGAGWGCAQLLKADFDTPLEPGEGSGGNGGSSSQSTGMTGGNPSTSSGSTSGTSSSVSSSGAGGAGGAGGCSDTNIDVCKRTAISVWLEDNNPCSDSTKAQTVNDDTMPGGLTLFSQFTVIDASIGLASRITTSLQTCTYKGKQQTRFDNSGKCDSVRTTLGYVFDNSSLLPKLKELKKIILQDGTEVIVLEDSTCCSNSLCSPTGHYALP